MALPFGATVSEIPSLGEPSPPPPKVPETYGATDTTTSAALKSTRLPVILGAVALGALLTLGVDALLSRAPRVSPRPPALTAHLDVATATMPEPMDGAAAREVVARALVELGVPLSAIEYGRYPLRGAGRRPDATLPLASFACPSSRACAELWSELAAPLRVGGFDILRNIGGDRPGRPMFRVVVSGGRPALALRAMPSGPRLTLIIDDLGREPAVLPRLLALDEHVTFAVLPNTSSGAQLAVRLADAGREVLVDLPMEPQPPVSADGPDFLSTEVPPDETAVATDRLFRRIPGAVGAINHLGGRLTTVPQQMAAVLSVVGERGQFFVDDRTSPASVAEATAKVMGVRTTARTHAVDLPGRDPAAALEAIESALVLDGRAVAVAHGQPATIAVLGPWLEGLSRRGIRLYRASEIAR